MRDRNTLIDAFLRNSQWDTWRRTQLAGDASTRRYERLHSSDDTVILMDAPRGNGTATTTFAALADYLSSCGLCPPEILAHDPQAGIMIISDLGSDDFASWLQTRPQDGDTLYQSATDVLLHLRNCVPPENLSVMSPEVGAQMISITGTYYAGKPADDLVSEMEQALLRLAPNADTLALRDYHAENLIWRPAMSGLAQVGLLDFQDAFIAPQGYDLVSLLRDARRDVAPDLRERVIADYVARAGLDDAFRAQLACLGVQRNLRILGVFARLATEMQKTHYLRLIPRVWHNLQADLAHPELTALRRVAEATLPAPQNHPLLRPAQ
ncbi:MAG: phosphotransferase [Pseudomonadota bacterium]